MHKSIDNMSVEEFLDEAIGNIVKGSVQRCYCIDDQTESYYDIISDVAEKLYNVKQREEGLTDFNIVGQILEGKLIINTSVKVDAIGQKDFSFVWIIGEEPEEDYLAPKWIN